MLGSWLLAAPASAQFVAPEGSSYHNGSSLPQADDGGAATRLNALREALVLGDASRVLDLLQRLRADPEERLVRLGARTFVPALEAAARLIMGCDDPALREQVLSRESKRVTAALSRRDLPALIDCAVRGESLPSAREASWLASRLLFEQGRRVEAAWLAARDPGRPAAVALLAAAGAAAAGASGNSGFPDPAPGPWVQALSFRERRDLDFDAPFALMLDGRPHEALLLDTLGLVGIDVEAAAKSFPDLLWGPAVLGMASFELGLPSPRRLSVARAGKRFVLPFNVTAEGRPGWRDPESRRRPALIAFDLQQPPVIAWRAVPSAQDQRVAAGESEGGGAADDPDQSATPDEPEGSAAMGPVTIAGDRVFAQVFRVGASTEVSLCAFSLASGERLFETPLVRGSMVRRFASRRAEVHVENLDKRASEGPVAVVDGVVWACTGYGVVAAVDAVSGRVLLSFRYDRVFSLDKDVYDPAFLFDTGGWEHEPVRVFGSRIVVAPSDSRFLYMLARHPGPAGQLILEDPIERLDRRQVLALLPDPGGSEAPAVLATRWRDARSSLVLLSPMGHTLLASEPLPADEPQTGPPARAGRAALLPTTKGVRVFDIDDLTRPPQLLPNPPDGPPARAVYPLSDGLMILSPGSDGALNGVYWKQVG